MAIEIYVPNIGTEALEVTEVLVHVGEQIEVEQPLITVEGDKVSMDIPSPTSGVVKELKVSIGDKINTGQLMITVENIETSNETLAMNNFVIKQDQDINIFTNKNSYKLKNNSQMEEKHSIIGIEKESNSIELPSKVDNINKGAAIKINNKIGTDQTIITSMVKNASFMTSEKFEQELINLHLSSKDSAVKFTDNDTYVHATPVIRRLARELGINLTKIKGTGRKGRITREDVYDYIKCLVKHSESISSEDVFSIANKNNLLPGLLSWPNVNFNKFGDTEEIEIGRIQKISGANLHRNWIMIPHVTQFDETDVTELEDFRKQQNAEIEKNNRNVKITLLVFIIKVVAKALKELPQFNSSLSQDNQRLILKKYINIGIAVNTNNGLIVPVLRDVNKKGIIEISNELTELSHKARSGKLSSLDIQGGCFTISNIGSFGGATFTPIINAPEVAILGVSKISTKPMWNGEKFIPRLMLPLSLSYDHRVIDGADGVRFMKLINDMISDIRLLVM